MSLVPTLSDDPLAFALRGLSPHILMRRIESYLVAKHSDNKEFIRASCKYARKEADAENIASYLFAIGVFIGTTAPGNGEEASPSPGETLR